MSRHIRVPLQALRHSNGSRQSILLPTARLPVIAEDGDMLQQPASQVLTAAASHRPWSRRWNIGDPPRHSFEKPPPVYSVDAPDYGFHDITGPKGERFANLRNNKHIARRGGWKRLCLYGLIFIAAAIAISVGLAIGLRKKDDSTPSTPSSSSNNSLGPTEPFPVGTYSLMTFLSTVATSCTSNPGTWRCYPYSTYTPSDPAAAMATFQWIITPGPLPSSYLISSTANPFAINFANLTLTLQDANTDNERYTFSTSVDKVVAPWTPITTDNSMAACQYNNTLFSATLYTRMRHTYPDQNPSTATTSTATAPVSTVTSGALQTWPYAVAVEQSVAGGADVPACYKVKDGKFGDKVTNGIGLTPQDSSQSCSCSYRNYDPDKKSGR